MIHSPTLIEAHQRCDMQSQMATSRVGANDSAAVESGLQDDRDRESRIHYHRQEMEAAMRAYEAGGCFADRGRADYHRIQFEREIADRSPEQRARMAAEQEQRLAIEPGATRQAA
jgi:hypothetical protein